MAETDKEAALQVIGNMPNDASLEEIQDEIALLIALEEGIRDAEAGRVISHEEMKRQMKQWLSK